MALRSKFGGVHFSKWPKELACRKPSAIEKAKGELADAIDRFRFGQFLLLRQWRMLREYAHQRGIGLLGDLPIFVAPDSSDVWAEPELFLGGCSARRSHCVAIEHAYGTALLRSDEIVV